jgi:putative flippase GtrA
MELRDGRDHAAVTLAKVRERKILRRLWSDQRVRFLLIGGINTGVGFVLFVAADLTLGRWLNSVSSVAASLATLLVSHLAAAVIAFALYRRLVFRVRGSILLDFIRFESVYLIPLAVNAFVLPMLVVWGMNRILAQAIILVVMTAVSYLGHQYFSFRRPPTRPAGRQREAS